MINAELMRVTSLIEGKSVTLRRNRKKQWKLSPLLMEK